MKEFWRKYHENIITFLLCAVLFVSVLSVIALFSGAIMKIFGLRYKTVGSIILFFICAAVVSYPLSLVAGTLPKVLLSEYKLTKQSAIFLYVILDTIATSFGLSIVDYFMKTVSATAFSIIFVSFILSLFGIHDIEKKPKGVG